VLRLYDSYMTQLKLVCIVIKSAPVLTSSSDVATAPTTLPTKSSTLKSSTGSDVTTTQAGVFYRLSRNSDVYNNIYC